MISLSRLVKSNLVNFGSGRFLYSAPVISVDVAVSECERQVEDAEDRLERMREVESYCADVREQALRQADEIRRQAQDEGFREGYDLGRSKAETECGKACDQVAQLMESLDEGRRELFERHEQELIDLALEIAGKVVADRIERDDEAFMRIFRKAVEGLSGQKLVRLRVSERELQFATAHADYLRAMIPDAEKLEIQLVEGAPHGTLIVDTEDKSIDASADRQLDVIGQALEDIRFQQDE
jgi:flagellar assembly protein FliH